jgi:hypothetical protein
VRRPADHDPSLEQGRDRDQIRASFRAWIWPQMGDGHLAVAGRDLGTRAEWLAGCPAITPSSLALCSAPSMLCALCGTLRPRVPRGLRALTAPARSASSGSYVMAGHMAARQRGCWMTQAAVVPGVKSLTDEGVGRPPPLA